MAGKMHKKRAFKGSFSLSFSSYIRLKYIIASHNTIDIRISEANFDFTGDIDIYIFSLMV